MQLISRDLHVDIHLQGYPILAGSFIIFIAQRSRYYFGNICVSITIETKCARLS